ncbi:MAG: hypothetical protein WCK05_08625 [Planctomycetota bacterium]
MCRHTEQRRIRWQEGRYRLAPPPGGVLSGRQPIRQPCPKVRRQFHPKHDPRSLPVLLVGGVEQGRRPGRVQVQLPDSQRTKLALAKAGQYQRLVDQAPFPPQLFQPGDQAGLAFQDHPRPFFGRVQVRQRQR